VAVAMTALLSALDGFDVLAISFAAPGIAEAWGIDRAALGALLAMELLGMALGSIFLGRVADRAGRRKTLMACLLVMVMGMYFVTLATSLAQLSVWRVITGIGIGGTLASINAVAAEFSNRRSRHLGVSLMVIGYPIGVVIGGSIAARLLEHYDWRSIFYLGTAFTALCIPLTFALVPESVQWLLQRRPRAALKRVNEVLARMGHAPLDELPGYRDVQRVRLSGILSTAMIATTAILTVAFFFHIATFYFLVKWIPKIVVDLGYAASSAADVLVGANLGGAIGGALFGFLTLRYDVRTLAIVALLGSAFAVALFGQSTGSLSALGIVAGFAGFAANAAIVGLYALFAHYYPTHVRATGTGFSIGIGRGGAMLSPILAGILLESGINVATVALVMSLGSMVAATALVFLRAEA